MDFDPQTWLYIVVAILFLVFGGLRRRKPPQHAPDRNTEENIPGEINGEVNVPSDSDIVIPPFMQNFEGSDPDVGNLQETIESEIADLPMETEQVEPENEQEPEPEQETIPIEPPPVPVDSPTKLPIRPLPVTSMIELSPETFRQGIILAEILGKPKGLRNRN